MATPAKNTKPTEPVARSSREAINIGINFDPIPLNVGDGKLWYFTPEAQAGQLDRLMALGREITDFSKTTDDDSALMAKVTEVGDKLSAAIADLLVDPEQGKQWVERNYGPLVQAAVVAKLVKELSGGFPTT